MCVRGEGGRRKAGEYDGYAAVSPLGPAPTTMAPCIYRYEK